MKLLLVLLRASWKTVALAGLIGAASGAASVGLIVLIMHTLRDPGASTAATIRLFSALCVLILLTRIISQMVLCRMTQANIAELRISLCRRILASPLKHLEEIGIDRMLGCLTGDVDLVSQAINGVPVLAVNLVILVCGMAYLGWLSLNLMAFSLIFAVLGVMSYRYSSRWASKHVARLRQAQDVLLKRVRGLIEGIKELKMHHDRRREYLEQVIESQDVVRQSKFLGDTFHDAAIAWGRLTFFIQRKRLALVTACLEGRPIYLFDEWAADQDPLFRKVFYWHLLPELKRRGKTVVAVTHDDRYFAAADQVIKLEEGKVVQTLRREAELDCQLASDTTEFGSTKDERILPARHPLGVAGEHD